MNKTRQMPGGRRHQKGDTTWMKAIWLGKHLRSDDHLVWTVHGLIRTRTVRRLEEGKRYDKELFETLSGQVWQPRIDGVPRPRRSRLEHAPTSAPMATGTEGREGEPEPAGDLSDLQKADGSDIFDVFGPDVSATAAPSAPVPAAAAPLGAAPTLGEAADIPVPSSPSTSSSGAMDEGPGFGVRRPSGSSGTPVDSSSFDFLADKDDDGDTDPLVNFELGLVDAFCETDQDMKLYKLPPEEWLEERRLRGEGDNVVWKSLKQCPEFPNSIRVEGARLISDTQTATALIAALLACLPRASGAEYNLGLDYSTNETCAVEVVYHGIAYSTFLAMSAILALICFCLGSSCGQLKKTATTTTPTSTAETQTNPYGTGRTVSTQSPCTYTWWWTKPQFKVLQPHSQGVGI